MKPTSLDELNPDPDQELWRYLDFPKFMSMLEMGSLFFSRLDLLGDPFEGSVTRADIDAHKEAWMAMSVKSGNPAGHYEEYYRNRDLDPRRNIFVNCWHMNQTESAAMWRLYAEEDKGIAIRSEVSLLLAELPSEARLRRVCYLDYSTDQVDTLSPVYCERNAFEHEREVRAVISRTHENMTPDGITVPIDLQTIQEIRVSPLTPNWQFELVERLAPKLGCAARVLRSELAAEPVFSWFSKV